MTADDRGSRDDYVEVGDDDDEERPKVRIVRNDDAIDEKAERVGEATEQAKKAVDEVRDRSRQRVDEATEEARETVEDTIQKGVDSLDSSLVDLLAGFLDTETRAKVYLYLRKRGEATSEEIAEDTGLYPSTVRECLSDLYREGIVERRKKQTEGAGNNPYVYTAVQPSDLARRFSERVEERLNQLFNLDSYLDSRRRKELKTDWSPYKIVIDSGDDEDDGR
ncbi:MAG: helix-turn-helix domain-containing protein [Halobacteriales archaeon]